MRAVRNRDTRPELLVRSLVHGMGYRYRLHRKDLPGAPDLTFPSRNAVIFVHGCFWHGHDCKRGRSQPKTNAEFWSNKIETNRLRDGAVSRKLDAAGFRSLVLWECELTDEVRLRSRVRKFLK